MESILPTEFWTKLHNLGQGYEDQFVVRFDPQTDITVQELAWCVAFLTSNHHGYNWLHTPMSIRRHFRVVS